MCLTFARIWMAISNFWDLRDSCRGKEMWLKPHRKWREVTGKSERERERGGKEKEVELTSWHMSVTEAGQREGQRGLCNVTSAEKPVFTISCSTMQSSSLFMRLKVNFFLSLFQSQDLLTIATTNNHVALQFSSQHKGVIPVFPDSPRPSWHIMGTWQSPRLSGSYVPQFYICGLPWACAFRVSVRALTLIQ